MTARLLLRHCLCSTQHSCSSLESIFFLNCYFSARKFPIDKQLQVFTPASICLAVGCSPGMRAKWSTSICLIYRQLKQESGRECLICALFGKCGHHLEHQWQLEKVQAFQDCFYFHHWDFQSGFKNMWCIKLPGYSCTIQNHAAFLISLRAAAVWTIWRRSQA